MNKQIFIDYLRSPERLTDGQFTELQKLLVDYPYFSIAKSIAARAAKDLDNPSKGGLIASAAIYATDRKHLKKYINGELVFLVDKPIVADDSEIILGTTDSAHNKPASVPEPELKEPITQVQDSASIDVSSLHVPDEGEVDQIIDELQRDMDDLKKSRLHFVEIQNQLDQETSTLAQHKSESKEDEAAQAAPAPASIAETPIEAPAAVSSITAIETEEKVSAPEIARSRADVTEKPAPKKEAPVVFDLDALKRELAREEDEKEKGEKSVVKEVPKPVEKTPKEKPPKAPRVRKVEDDADDEDMKEPPPVVTVPGSITNMSPAEENDDDEDADIQLPRRKSERKPRKPIAKIKREDLEKILGKKATASGSESKVSTEKSTEEKPEKPKLEKIKTVFTDEESVEKPKTRKEPKVDETEKIQSDEVKPERAIAQEDKIENTPAPTEIKEPTAASAPMAEKVEEPQQSKPVESATTPSSAPIPATKDEEPARNSIKAFLDLGISVERTSVSRASSSRSKRSARANRTRPSDEGTGDGKGDDESSGTGSLIDKFIQENPSIQRRQLADEKADLSQDSGKWNPELASEYLAQIYLDQGNTKRAILIYETLSLKFPEKKSYFAGLIEKLKK